MPEFISNTSSLQYLHQVGVLDWLRQLMGSIIIPRAVAAELAVRRKNGVDLPEIGSMGWISVRSPAGAPAAGLVHDLGPGEAEVITLALESSDAVTILDDALARRVATNLGIRITGTIGVLIDTKRAGLTDTIAPLLDKLNNCGFDSRP